MDISGLNIILSMITVLLSAILCATVDKAQPNIHPAFYWIVGVITGYISIIIAI